MYLWKESIVFPDVELRAESFQKNSLKKSNIPEASQTLKILGVTISSLRISPVAPGQLRKISCNWGKCFYDDLKGKDV